VIFDVLVVVPREGTEEGGQLVFPFLFFGGMFDITGGFVDFI
jgi:hypothetical protein